MVIKYYTIRNRTTGRYLKGTPAYHSWFVDDPRLFPSIGRLRSFITSAVRINKTRRERWPDMCADVSTWVIDEMVLTPVGTQELHQVVTGKKIMELLAA
jgi:hypothetical protein